MRFSRKIKFIIIIVTIFFVGAVFFVSREKDRLDIETVQIKKNDIANRIQESGVIKPRNEVIISSLEKVKVSKILSRKGDKVKLGQVLFKFDTSEKDDFVKRAKIKLEQAKIDILAAKYRPKLEQTLAKKKEELALTELKLVQDQRNRLNIVSPIDGTILESRIKKGLVNTPGQELMRIANTDELYVLASINELDAASIKNGQKAFITFEGLPSKSFEANVVKVAEAAIIKEGRVVVETELEFLKHPSGLKIGNQVDIELVLDTAKNANTLPLRSIQRDEQNRPFIVTFSKQNGFKKKRIKMGLSNFDFAQILDGVIPEDNIVMDPKRLKDSDFK